MMRDSMRSQAIAYQELALVVIDSERECMMLCGGA